MEFSSGRDKVFKEEVIPFGFEKISKREVFTFREAGRRCTALLARTDCFVHVGLWVPTLHHGVSSRHRADRKRTFVVTGGNRCLGFVGCGLSPVQPEIGL